MIKLDPEDKNLIIDLILQRTGAFLEIPGSDVPLSNWFKFGDREGLYNHLVSSSTLDFYLDRTLEELACEAKDLSCATEEVDGNLISIGPGNGLIELMLMDSGHFSDLMLVDIERTDDHHHGYNESGSGYTDLERTRTFIKKNLGEKVGVSTWNPRKQSTPKFRFDCMISILSMGFHYPCDEYVSFIKHNSRKGALIILDLRKQVCDNGYRSLLALCSNSCVLSESKKSQRLKLTIK